MRISITFPFSSSIVSSRNKKKLKIPVVLVSQDYSNKVGGLKQLQNYCLTVLETRIQNQDDSDIRAMFPLNFIEESFLASSQLLVVCWKSLTFLVLQLPNCNLFLCHHMMSSLYVSIFIGCLIRTPVISYKRSTYSSMTSSELN